MPIRAIYLMYLKFKVISSLCLILLFIYKYNILKYCVIICNNVEFYWLKYKSEIMNRYYAFNLI